VSLVAVKNSVTGEVVEKPAPKKLSAAFLLEWYIKLFLGVHFADNLA
jgi:hypothetical protein